MQVLFNKDKDTICATATAHGVGGIAVVRVSGANALSIVSKSAKFLPERPESHKVFYGLFSETSSCEPIDEVLITGFLNGRSFTGEECLEISCHGGTVVVQRILDELIKNGARMAEPGEFTYRAFINGRIDLIQAESILNLIESKSKKSAQLSLRQLQGELSSEVEQLEDLLLWVGAQLEANIDYAAEDIVVAANTELLDKALQAKSILERLTQSFRAGNKIVHGTRISLVGSPNAGKSSLLNKLIGEDKSIVTEIAGTTRDAIEVNTLINQQAVTLVDTAGLRNTSDQVELLGIAKTKENIVNSDEVLFIVDASESFIDLDIEQIRELDMAKVNFVINKIDKDKNKSTAADIKLQFEKLLSRQNLEVDSEQIYPISVKENLGINELKQRIAQRCQSDLAENTAVVTQTRHYESFSLALERLNKAISLLKENESPDFIVFEIKDALLSIHKVLGKEYDDQIMDRVFKEFCLGK